MEQNVFVSGYNISSKSVSVVTSFQLTLRLFDKFGEETKFCSSLMGEDQINAYQKNILKALNCLNWTQAIHGVPLHSLKIVYDDDDSKKIIGLETKKGLVLKNTVKFY